MVLYCSQLRGSLQFKMTSPYGHAEALGSQTVRGFDLPGFVFRFLKYKSSRINHSLRMFLFFPGDWKANPRLRF